MGNTPEYGNNLDILKCHMKNESVDFVYLDHSFNSNANYNVFVTFSYTNKVIMKDLVLMSSFAAMAVVPLPMNGSKTTREVVDLTPGLAFKSHESNNRARFINTKTVISRLGTNVSITMRIGVNN